MTEANNASERVEPEVDHRSSPEEMKSRMLIVREKLAQGLSDWTIKAELAAKFGCSRKTVARYLSILRKRIRSETDPAKIDDLKADSLEFFRGIYSDPKQPAQARIRAKEQADKLLGLYVQRIELGGTVNLSLKEEIRELDGQELTDAELELLAKAGEIVKKLPSVGDEDEG